MILASNSGVYEGMFILDPNQYAREPAAVSGQVSTMIEKCGGEVLASRLWNEQRLAFPIQGHRKGTYWLTYFKMDTAGLADFRRACQLNDTVLRSLTLKVDPRLVDTLVAHARGERPAAEPETPEAVPVPAVEPEALEAVSVPDVNASDAPADDGDANKDD